MTRALPYALLALLFVAVEVALILWVDRPLSEYMRTLDQQHHAFINIFRAYTDFGRSKWYLPPAGVGILFCAVVLRMKSLAPHVRQPLAALGEKLLFLFCCVAISGIVTDIIKPILGRARPVELDREGLYGFAPLTFHATWNSMPSGHATTACALAGVLYVFWPRGWLAWMALAILLAGSRVMVNAHFLSDTLAGAVVGLTIVALLWRAFLHDRIFPVIKCLFPIDRRENSR